MRLQKNLLRLKSKHSFVASHSATTNHYFCFQWVLWTQIYIVLATECLNQVPISTFAFVKKWVRRRLMATLYIKVHPLIFSPTQFVVLASYAVRPHMFQVSIKEMKTNVPLLSDHFCSLMAVNDNTFTCVMFYNLHIVINTKFWYIVAMHKCS